MEKIIYKQTFRETSISTIQCGTTRYFVIKQRFSIAIDWICDSERGILIGKRLRINIFSGFMQKYIWVGVYFITDTHISYLFKNSK